MPSFVVVIGHGPDLEAPEGAATLLRTLGAEVRTLDLWDEGAGLFDEEGATARAIVIEAGERPDLAVAALRAVRKTAELTEIPAIVAVSPRQIARIEPASGFDDFIVLPCVPSELYARIRQLEWRRSEFAASPTSAMSSTIFGGISPGSSNDFEDSSWKSLHQPMPRGTPAPSTAPFWWRRDSPAISTSFPRTARCSGPKTSAP